MPTLSSSEEERAEEWELQLKREEVEVAKRPFKKKSITTELN